MDINTLADFIYNKIEAQGDVRVRKDKIIAWLHYSADGQALVKGLSTPPPTLTLRRDQALQQFASRNGAKAICKYILESEDAASAFSEQEFTDILMQEARHHQKPDETIGSAFSRMFSAPTAEGLLLRKAHAKVKEANYPPLSVGKAHTPPPTQVGGREATDINDGSVAYGKLTAMAEQLHALSPELTFAQAFARVYMHPENAALAEAERRHNRPRVNKDAHQ
jgi:hypothetical protein